MEVRSISCEQDESEFVVTIVTDTFEPLYFRYSQEISEENVGELALMSLLLPSMSSGTTLTIPSDYPVCPLLLKRIDYIQEVFCAWYPSLSFIEIIATEKNAEVKDEIKGISFFSGGLDSLYTFYKVRNDIDHILFCRGMDIQLSEIERFQHALAHCSDFAKDNNIRLVSVVTNCREVITNYKGVIMHGAFLIGIASVLSPKRIFVPGTHTLLELFPWGSHPFTDPLFAIGSNKVVHHGACRRSQKLLHISENQEALDLLRVCNSSDEYNCGKCEKCLRTTFALKVIEKQSAALPEITQEQCANLRVYNENEASFWEDNALFAKEMGKPLLQKAALKAVKRYKIRSLLKGLFATLKRA